MFSCFLLGVSSVSDFVFNLSAFSGSSTEAKGQSQRTLPRHPTDRLGCEPHLQGPHHVHASLRCQVGISQSTAALTLIHYNKNV